MKTADYDILGASASMLCMVHCILTPFLFAAQATVSSTCSDISPMWWKTVDVLFLVITFFAIFFTSKNTLLKWIPTTLYMLWGIYALLVLNKFFHLISIPHSIIYVPAISLSILHLYNKNYCSCHSSAC